MSGSEKRTDERLKSEDSDATKQNMVERGLSPVMDAAKWRDLTPEQRIDALGLNPEQQRVFDSLWTVMNIGGRELRELLQNGSPEVLLQQAEEALRRHDLKSAFIFFDQVKSGLGRDKMVAIGKEKLEALQAAPSTVEVLKVGAVTDAFIAAGVDAVPTELLDALITLYTKEMTNIEAGFFPALEAMREHLRGVGYFKADRESYAQEDHPLNVVRIEFNNRQSGLRWPAQRLLEECKKAGMTHYVTELQHFLEDPRHDFAKERRRL